MTTSSSQMEIVVHGRNVVVPDHYRVHVADKLVRLERYDHTVVRAEVELSHEPNPRQSGHSQHVEITCHPRGPVVRAEGSAENFYTALDIAIGKLERQLRTAADRRHIHYGRQTPQSVSEATRPDGMDTSTGATPLGA